MTWLDTPLKKSIFAGLVVGFVHYIGHNIFGNSASFAAAGVNAAGISVTLAAFAVTLYLANQWR